MKNEEPIGLFFLCVNSVTLDEKWSERRTLVDGITRRKL